MRLIDVRLLKSRVRTTLSSINKDTSSMNTIVWNTRRSTLAYAILSILTLCSSGACGSPADELIPKTFDPESKYKTYSYKELFEHLEKTRTTRAYVGEKVKTFVRYAFAPFGNINPIMNDVQFGWYVSLGRNIALPKVDAKCLVCDKTLPAADPDSMAFGNALDALWNSFQIYLAFPSFESLRSYMRDVLMNCLERDPTKPGWKKEDAGEQSLGCYAVVAGTLGAEEADFKTSLRPFGPGAGKSLVSFISVEKIEVYKDENWAKKEFLKIGSYYIAGGKLLVRVFTTIPK